MLKGAWSRALQQRKDVPEQPGIEARRDMDEDAVALQGDRFRVDRDGQLEEGSGRFGMAIIEALAPVKEGMIAHGVIAAPGGNAEAAAAPVGKSRRPVGGVMGHGASSGAGILRKPV